MRAEKQRAAILSQSAQGEQRCFREASVKVIGKVDITFACPASNLWNSGLLWRQP
jgi:hypothetical protein